MRLTKYIRQAFVNAAMQDVPKVDYIEQVRKQVLKEFEDLMPPEVKVAYAKHPEWFNRGDYYYISGVGNSFAVPRPTNMRLPEDALARVNNLVNLYKEQNKKLNELQDKLTAVAEGASTRKALVAALPEFEKYLPAEVETPVRSLPAIANVVAEFTKAGWPKGEKKDATK
jgi:hypothetical protein